MPRPRPSSGVGSRMTPSPRPPRPRTRSPVPWTTRRARSRSGRTRCRSSRRARSPRSATTEMRTVAILLDVFRSAPAIVSPRYAGKRGHPVVLPPALRDEIRAADPSITLHDVLKRHPDLRVDVDVEDRGVVRDVDRVADLGA